MDLVTESKQRGSSALLQQGHHLISLVAWKSMGTTGKRESRTSPLRSKSNTRFIHVWCTGLVLTGDTGLGLVSCYEKKKTKQEGSETWRVQEARFWVNPLQNRGISLQVIGARSLHRNTCTSSSQLAISNCWQQDRPASTRSWTDNSIQAPETTTKSHKFRDLKAHWREASKLWCFSREFPFFISSLHKNSLFLMHLLTSVLDAKSSMILSSPEKNPYFCLPIIKYSNTVHDVLSKNFSNNLCT